MPLVGRLILLAIVILSSLTVSSAAAPAIPLDRSTPRQSLATFLAHTDEKVKDFRNASLLLQTGGIPPGDEISLAKHLREIIRGRGLYIRTDAVPNSADYIDPETQRSEYRPYPKEPRISLVRDGDKWVFSAYTVQTIPDMYGALYPFGLDFLAELTPEHGSQFLGVFLWQWLGMGILIVLSFLLIKLLQPIGAWFVRWCFRRLNLTETDAEIYRRIGRSLALLITALVVSLLLPLLRLPLEVSRHAVTTINVLMAVFAIITGYRLVDAVVEHIAWTTAKGRQSHVQLRPLLRRSLKLVVIIVGVVAILQQFNVNLTAVIAGLSIGGVAVALASQDTLRNLLGALMIMTDKPFVVGDKISVQGAEGVVEDIGLRSTRLRTTANSIVFIPNGRLADMTIDNLGMRVMRQYRIVLNLSFDTAPEQMQAFIDGLRTIVMEHPNTVKTLGATTISFNEYGDFSLKVLFQCFFESSTPDDQQNRMNINLSIQKLATDLGVSFATQPHTLVQAGHTL